MALVELNRLRSMRESAAGRLDVLMLELKNSIGMQPEDQLRLRGDFDNLTDPLRPLADATGQALRDRPDLLTARAMETLADARIEQARAAGRPEPVFQRVMSA